MSPPLLPPLVAVSVLLYLGPVTPPQDTGQTTEWLPSVRYPLEEYRRNLSYLEWKADGPPEEFGWHRVSVQWQVPTFYSSDLIEPSLHFRGRLTWQNSEGEVRPIDWAQGLRFLISRYPERTLDWSNGHSALLASWLDGNTAIDGTFGFRLPLSEIFRTPNATARFQIGLVVTRMEGTVAIWDGSSGALPQSVAFASIPGPPGISESAQLISASGGVHASSFRPQAAIRAANHLLSLGKEGAFREMEDYLCIAGSRWAPRLAAGTPSTLPIDPANLDHADIDNITLLVQLVFTPKEGDSYPRLWVGGAVPVQPETINSQPGTLPIAVRGDVPFVLAQSYVRLGGLPDLQKLLDWARDSAVLRQPWHPVDDPRAAAKEVLVMLRSIDAEYADQVEPLLLRQLYWSIGSVLPPVDHHLRDHPFIGWTDENTRWDESSQAWVGRDAEH